MSVDPHQDFDLDALIADLPTLDPPADLNVQILDLVAQTEQDSAPMPVGAATAGAPAPTAAPANRRWLWWAGPAVLLAAALLVAIMVVPSDSGVGDPDDWTARGEVGAGPGIDLAMAVRTADGTQRYTRGQAYNAGETLVFRVNAHAAGSVYLVRIDDLGVELLHDETLTAGTSNLMTEGQMVGYALESGEGTAVFAVIRADQPIAPSTLVEGLAVDPDVDTVCAAALDLGARCAAERVEAVP